MPYYRMYRVDADGHILGPAQIVSCDSDEEIIRKATAEANGVDLEVWEHARLVARIKSRLVRRTGT